VRSDPSLRTLRCIVVAYTYATQRHSVSVAPDGGLVWLRKRYRARNFPWIETAAATSPRNGGSDARL